MEKDEREAMEARILWLRDIQTLLDSAVEQMHQYTTVMSALQTSRQHFKATNQNMPSASSSQPTHSPETAEAETLSAGIAGATPPTPTKSDAELLGTRPKTTPFSSTSNPIPEAAASSSSLSDSTHKSPLSDQEEVRRRRLAKFQQSPPDADS
ncbi:hypothetical protein EB796_006853 [Bugula neritina]|uniref:Uncharacterized protein n=1 Tax=Bugula neritina TaxID=10212 RepID=A0A7J7K9B4_BUGNE|nr:hypothetical protein EB796_006853 [Bugula neritina]